MKFEDLRIGMKIKRDFESTCRTITAIGEVSYLYKGKEVLEERTDLASTLDSFSEFKEKKKYWIWKVKNKGNGLIFKTDHFLDESGTGADGIKRWNSDNYDLFEKYENDFIEI